jgi:hypothetical protein
MEPSNSLKITSHYKLISSEELHQKPLKLRQTLKIISVLNKSKEDQEEINSRKILMILNLNFYLLQVTQHWLIELILPQI